jgi:hypothetical protein
MIFKSAPAFAAAEEPVSDRDLIISLLAQIVVLRAELAHARSLIPGAPPAGWKRVKEMAAMLHRSAAAIYKAVSEGRYESKKIKSQIWIDPNSRRPRKKSKRGG